MTIEASKAMPAAEGTQASATPELAKKPETTTTPATAPASTPAGLRQQMFGNKTSKKPEAEPDKKQEAAPQSSDQKATEPEKDDNASQQEQGEKATEPHKPKTAKDRIVELANEKNEWKNKALESSEKLAKLQAELEELKAIKDEDKTAKEQYREFFLEEKLKEQEQAAIAEVNDYVAASGDPDMFIANYNYYMPKFQRDDAWTIAQIERFPEKLKMLDMFFKTMTAGVFTMDEWLKAPEPLKMQKILDLRKIILNPPKPPAKAAEQTPAAPAAKDLPDSVVPNLNPKHDAEQPKAKGSTFNKVFNRLK